MTVRLAAFCIVLVAVAAGCGERTPVSPSAMPADAPATAAVSTARTPVRIVGELNGQTYFGPLGSCPGPSRATISEVAGTLSHLGLSSVTSQHCYLGGNADGSMRYQGAGVFVAANGDELTATYSGSMFGLVPTPGAGSLVTGTATMVVTGGTGRFKDASGDGTLAVEVTFSGGATPSPIKLSFDLSIVY